MIHVEQIRQGRSLPLDWETGADYVIGDKVVSSLVLYRCHTAHTSAGAFDATKFTAITTGGGGGGVGVQIDTQTASGTVNQTTTSASYVDIVGATLTTAALAGGNHKYFVIFNASFETTSGSALGYFRLMVDGVAVATSEIYGGSAGSGNKVISIGTSCSTAALDSGKIIKAQFYRSVGGTLTLRRSTLSIIGVP